MKIDRESTGYKLFKTIFHCRVKAKHLIDLERAATYGQQTTGDDEYDAELGESLTDVYLPTSDIAELNHDGVDVMIVNHSDVIRLYEIINDHLEWWESKFRTMFFIDPDRLKRVKRDIEILGRLSDAVYPSIKAYVRKRDSHLTTVEDTIMPHRPDEQFYGLDEGDVSGFQEAVVAPHRTIEDIFGVKTLNRVRAWEVRK
ncbi:hypothetical protein pEaSNUABM54_00012 [Erwinia phage pEa_SNUABM_54]|nr:hypothetical protein pEaSNUABM54_00012 [Erwinia phage pEa_SNUABM_54]